MVHVNQYLTFVFIFSLVITGCASMPEEQPFQPSGFLNDFSFHKEKLKEDGGDALLGFWKTGVNWPTYKKIILAPVAVKKTPGSKLNGMIHSDVYRLKELLEYSVRDSLKNGFKLVNRPGVDTLLIQLSITDLDVSTVLQDAFSKNYVGTRVLSELRRFGFGKGALIGKTSVEAVITDSSTGDLLVEYADIRTDSSFLVDSVRDGGFGSEKIFNYIADQVSFQLCQRKGLNNCKKFEEL